MPEDRFALKLDPVARYHLDALTQRLGLNRSELVRLALAEMAQRRKVPSFPGPAESPLPR